MTLIWATRGRTWGFRFLRNGGLPDPLPAYDAAFVDLDDEPEAWRRDGDVVALRFPDPMGRRDAAGRVIPHEFLISGPMAAEVGSIQDGLRRVWPLVADEFASVWEQPRPPSAA